MGLRIRVVALSGALAALLAGPATAQDLPEDIGTLLLDASSPVLRAICEGDTGPLIEQPMSGLLYLQEVVANIHDPGLSWRVPPHVRLVELNPLLPRVINARILTSRKVYDDSMQLGLEVGFGALMPFLEERERNIETGALDPTGEIAALMGGLVDAASGFGRAMAGAERDAEVMVAFLTYPETLQTFRACYGTILSHIMEES
jgi:hypothetical protein